jgi:replication factor A1
VQNVKDLKYPKSNTKNRMHPTKNQLYELVKDITSKQEFEQEIQNLSEEFDNLINEDTLALLIVDRMGRNTQAITKIADIQPDKQVTTIGKITTINPPRTFTRKNGSNGEVVNLELQDETGTCTLVLWNKDVNHVKNNTIKTGSIIKIINGYVKQGFTGIEVNLGRWGILEIDPKDTTNYDQIKPPKTTQPPNEITGEITRIEPTRAFFKDNGEFGFVATIYIKTAESEQPLVIWDQKVKEIQQFNIGDHLKITQVTCKRTNGRTELHVNGASMIKRC